MLARAKFSNFVKIFQTNCLIKFNIVKFILVHYEKTEHTSALILSLLTQLPDTLFNLMTKAIIFLFLFIYYPKVKIVDIQELLADFSRFWRSYLIF